MQTALKDGIFVPPSSLVRGYARLSCLQFDMQRCVEHLHDKTRRARYASGREYYAWRRKAEYALECFELEHDQLIDWLEQNEPALLRKVFDIARDVDDLSEEEQQTLAEASALFALHK